MRRGSVILFGSYRVCRCNRSSVDLRRCWRSNHCATSVGVEAPGRGTHRSRAFLWAKTQGSESPKTGCRQQCIAAAWSAWSLLPPFREPDPPKERGPARLQHHREGRTGKSDGLRGVQPRSRTCRLTTRWKAAASRTHSKGCAIPPINRAAALECVELARFSNVQRPTSNVQRLRCGRRLRCDPVQSERAPLCSADALSFEARFEGRARRPL
jgi:hypothetical protein